MTSITGSDWTTITGFVVGLGRVCCYLGTPSRITIPGSVREIGDRAFEDLDALRELSFEEGLLKIGVSAFRSCSSLASTAFPASLTVIEAEAFYYCIHLREITFAVGSQLQYIGSRAFSDCCYLHWFVVPASIVEIDPAAFDSDVWIRCVVFTGPPLYAADDHFLYSVDSTVVFRSFPDPTELLIGSTIEVIAAWAFWDSKASAVLFESGTRLREIGSRAFGNCSDLEAFKVPESVEIIGDHCFEDCSAMETIEFEGRSRLKRIGERAFFNCNLYSITIPALTEEIDGSAFVNCPLFSMEVAPGGLHFKIEGSLLVTSDGTEIVRSFGQDREIVVGKKVKVLRKSCCEACQHLDKIDFEVGSELERIDRAALRDCISLEIVAIPASVAIIDESSFEGCTELGSCLMANDSSLVTIGAKAFAKCTSLRSFVLPPLVEEIGSNCFNECIHLYRLKFMSSECLQRVIGAGLLDDALYEFGVSGSSSLFRIEVGDGGGVELKFPGWTYVCGCEEDSDLSLVRDIQ
jgi:hypothetical protein